MPPLERMWESRRAEGPSAQLHSTEAVPGRRMPPQPAALLLPLPPLGCGCCHMMRRLQGVSL